MKLVLWLLALFSAVNVVFITYSISLEALVIPDIDHIEQYPVWPPRVLVDALHKSWVRPYDPMLAARPVWYKTLMCWEVLFFGPYYIAVLIATLTKGNWIRMPTVIYSSVMLTKMSILISEEIFGEHKSPRPDLIAAVHLPYVLLPLLLIAFMWKHPKPFGGLTEKQKVVRKKENAAWATAPAVVPAASTTTTASAPSPAKKKGGISIRPLAVKPVAASAPAAPASEAADGKKTN
eukprot:TRINITY_DN3863_c0_g1_i1.p1 TRINITY_DN3863_c0_g1~~TRINITY_DN3863_c0_g1_i1.p1  ORF type:complete len:246 (+),score=70.22 TRINITY_DN3863_c0_g1_i1:34-738(+)